MGGSLTTYLREGGAVSWYARRRIAIDVATSLQYLHTQYPPIIHRDIKSQNVLVSVLSLLINGVLCLYDLCMMVVGCRGARVRIAIGVN